MNFRNNKTSVIRRKLLFMNLSFSSLNQNKSFSKKNLYRKNKTILKTCCSLNSLQYFIFSRLMFEK